ncbi:hypothetical protein EYR38_003340 [Pleurotus pulmonarius]|nr:hypothetical protein EYR38_003340 [Pleurotus pulmonarius]
MSTEYRIAKVATSVEDHLKSNRFVVDWAGPKNDDVYKAAMAITSTWEDLAISDENTGSRTLYRTHDGNLANIIAFKIGRTTVFLFVVKIGSKWAFQGCVGNVEPKSDGNTSEKELWEHLEEGEDPNPPCIQLNEVKSSSSFATGISQADSADASSSNIRRKGKKN